jgi:hypothetical protein
MWTNLPIFHHRGAEAQSKPSILLGYRLFTKRMHTLHVGRGVRDPVHEARHSISLRLCASVVKNSCVYARS